MRNARLLLALFVFLLSAAKAVADAEVESNDTPSLANTLTSGVTMNGHSEQCSQILITSRFRLAVLAL